MKRIPKMSGIFRGNCCKTCGNISQKTPMNGFDKKNSLSPIEKKIKIEEQNQPRSNCTGEITTPNIFFS